MERKETEMKNRELYIETHKGLTIDALKELMKIVERQNTTDKKGFGEYVVIDDNDIQYFYTIDLDYDVVLTDIRY